MQRRDFLKLGLAFSGGALAGKLISGNNPDNDLLKQVINQAYLGHSTHTYYSETQLRA